MHGPVKGYGSTILSHPQVAQIELELARGISIKNIARRYSLSRDALYRHRRRMSPQLKAQLRIAQDTRPIDLEKLRETESTGLLQHLMSLRGRAYNTLTACDEANDSAGSARMHNVILRNLETTGKLLGELDTGARTVVNNLTITGEYLELRHKIVRALAPFPDARAAVSAALRETEVQAVPKLIEGSVIA